MITLDVSSLQLINLVDIKKKNCFITCIKLSLVINLNNFYTALKIYNNIG